MGFLLLRTSWLPILGQRNRSRGRRTRAASFVYYIRTPTDGRPLAPVRLSRLEPVKLASPACRDARYRAVVAGCALAVAAGAACAAPPPYVQLVGAVGTLAIPPATCSGAGPASSFIATIDLGSGGAYRYSPAGVLRYFFDDEGECNLVYNQDVTLLVSPYFVTPIAQSNQPFPVAPVSTWYAAI